MKLSRGTPYGMTFLELVVVLFVMALLFVGSIPVFTYLREKRQKEEVELIKKRIETGLSSRYYTEVLMDDGNTYPSTLDTNVPGAPCEKCFEFILPKGLAHSQWYKKNMTTYYFILDKNQKKNQWTLDHRGNYRLKYNSQLGKITLERI